MDVSKAHERATVEASLWQVAVHGNLCLALRHPGNQGETRALVVSIVHQLAKLLVERGILTQEEMDYATKVEQNEHGLERVI